MKNKIQQILNLGEYQVSAKMRLNSWKQKNFARRLKEKDHTLWFPNPTPEITDRLGWLVLPERINEKLYDLVSFAEEVKAERITHVLLLGMGGSSLAPEVFHKTFGKAKDFPELIVLDSTHPAALYSVEDRINLSQTLFLVSSKSGITLETLSLFRYFWNQVSSVVDKPGLLFVAITDPGTPLVKLAQERGFRRIFEASPDVGGRYSALSVFGLVPAALIGMDIFKLLERTRIEYENYTSSASEEASGLVLGAALGEVARDRDKLTILTSSSLAYFPDWLEQLVAESTGKEGKGIVPVVNEPQAPIDTYGHDRIFVCLFLERDSSREQEDRMIAFEEAGYPGIRIKLGNKIDLGQEIYRWEVAITAAGSVLGIHPFNQPDVELTKELTHKAMKEVKKVGRQGNREAETVLADEAEELAKALKNWMAEARSGDYVALQAYLTQTPDIDLALQHIRFELLNRFNLATTKGYGPRFLHSTGQMHKGGPNSGLFLQLVDKPGIDLPVPETDYTFGSLIRAQALADYQALKQRGRRVLRVNLRSDVLGALERLKELIRSL